MTGTRKDAWIALSLTALIAAFLFYTHANRVVLTNDEGIILDAAQRIASGQRAYVDFFTYMSPGSYWLQAIVFRCFGVSLVAGRVLVILDLAIQCGLLYWLIARLGTRRAGVVAALLFLAFQANPESLTAQHRWDSATLTLAAVCLCVRGMTGTRRHWIAAGILAGFAAVCTPAAALVIAAIAGWLALSRDRRLRMAPFLLGVVGVAGLAVGILAAGGSFSGFLNQLAWLRHNYSSVNAMPYGSIIGGYAALLRGASGMDLIAAPGIVACLALPAILPLLAAGLWLRKRIEPEIALLLACSMALVCTVFPRADIAHLTFVAALPAALVTIWTARHLAARTCTAVTAVLALFAAAFLLHFTQAAFSGVELNSPAGRIFVSNDQASEMQRLLTALPSGSNLYVHPYLPLLYFLSQTKNPTRFPDLAPGMMTQVEESEVMADLSRQPPDAILYLQLDREEFLRVFPGAAHLDHRFRAVETWIQGNYRPSDPPLAIAGYQLWRPATSSESPTFSRNFPGSPRPSLPVP